MSAQPAHSIELPGATALDRLAVLAVVVACGPIPFLGIGHPLTHVLILCVVIAFGWLMVAVKRPGEGLRSAIPQAIPRGITRAVVELDLGPPKKLRGWTWVATAGVASGLVRYALDERWLHGGWGIDFYRRLLVQYHVLDDSGAHWLLLAAQLGLLLVVILLDGVFFSGLIQQRVAAYAGLHLGVLLQALLFSLPHTFAGPDADLAYGVGTFFGGVAYGYLYRGYRNHWIPGSFLWLHVAVVFALISIDAVSAP